MCLGTKNHAINVVFLACVKIKSLAVCKVCQEIIKKILYSMHFRVIYEPFSRVVARNCHINLLFVVLNFLCWWVLLETNYKEVLIATHGQCYIYDYLSLYLCLKNYVNYIHLWSLLRSDQAIDTNNQKIASLEKQHTGLLQSTSHLETLILILVLVSKKVLHSFYRTHSLKSPYL